MPCIISPTGLYRFSDYPYGCTNRDCDRDAICLKVAKALHKKGAKSVEIQRCVPGLWTMVYAHISMLSLCMFDVRQIPSQIIIDTTSDKPFFYHLNYLHTKP